MFLRRLKLLPRTQTATYATLNTEFAFEIKEPAGPSVPASHYRIEESDVDKHCERHLGKFYTIPMEQKKQLFAHGGFPKKFEMQVKTFAEACLMVREPALELINYVRNTDLNRPVVRYVLYGDNGAGKTLSMAHVLHYGMQNGFLLVHVPWAPNWMKRPKETTFQDGTVDLPFDSAAWLVHFRTQNANLLANSELTLSRDYVWNQRERTPQGSNLSELLEHGISRIKFASAVIEALLAEIKLLATEGRCKVMVAIDGYNAFFHPITRIFAEHKVRISPDKITLRQPFLDITNYDWTHGVCILSVDKIAMTEGYMESYLPRYLLGKQGFEHLDPFVPVRVSNYNEQQFAACINYYLDRRWLQRTPEGFDEQLKYLSAMNPYTLMRLTSSL